MLLACLLAIWCFASGKTSFHHMLRIFAFQAKMIVSHFCFSSKNACFAFLLVCNCLLCITCLSLPVCLLLVCVAWLPVFLLFEQKYLCRIFAFRAKILVSHFCFSSKNACATTMLLAFAVFCYQQTIVACLFFAF